MPKRWRIFPVIFTRIRLLLWNAWNVNVAAKREGGRETESENTPKMCKFFQLTDKKCTHHFSHPHFSPATFRLASRWFFLLLNFQHFRFVCSWLVCVCMCFYLWTYIFWPLNPTPNDNSCCYEMHLKSNGISDSLVLFVMFSLCFSFLLSMGMKMPNDSRNNNRSMLWSKYLHGISVKWELTGGKQRQWKKNQQQQTLIYRMEWVSMQKRTTEAIEWENEHEHERDKERRRSKKWIWRIPHIIMTYKTNDEKRK